MSSSNLLKIIEEFKEKGLDGIEYEYSQYDIDYARMRYSKDLSFGQIEYGQEFDPDKYLRPQEEIFPVKNSSKLIWLVGMLYLYEQEVLVKEFYDLVKSHDDLKLKGFAFVDNDKSLSWDIENSNALFFIGYYMSESYSINDQAFRTPGDILQHIKFYTNHLNGEILVMIVAHFIYTNIKEGKL